MAKVRRLSHTQKKINKLNRETTKAMRIWGASVIEDAREHAPILSGALRDNLVMSNVKTYINQFTIEVGLTDEVMKYAVRQEMDTSLGFGPRSQAEGATRPWLKPAFEQNRTYGMILLRLATKKALG